MKSEAHKFELVLETLSQFFNMEDPVGTFSRTIRDIMEAFPDCVIVGGIAQSYYMNNPRATKDIDIALAGDFPEPGRFTELFETVPGMPFTLLHKETRIQVDLLTSDHPVANSEILAMIPAHVNVMEQGGTSIRLAKPEMIIGLKIKRAIHNTPQGLQDRADILSLLKDNPLLDLGMIEPHLSEEEGEMLDDLIRFGKELLDD